jgi:hypothetical protein
VIVPLHLPDALEYKFLGCIPDHHLLWMASSEIRMEVQISPLQCRQGRTRAGGGGGFARRSGIQVDMLHSRSSPA